MAVESPFPTPGQDPWTSIVQWAEEVEQTTNATEQTVNEGRLSPDQLSATIGERVGTANTVVILGDSIALHNAIFDAGTGTYYIPGAGWFWWTNARLRGALSLTANLGISGERTDQIGARVSDAIAAAPDICVEEGGTNDIFQGRTAAQIIASRTATQDALLAAGIAVVAAEIPPASGWTTDQKTVAQRVNAWLTERAANVKRLTVARWWRAIVDPATGSPTGTGNTWDGVHLTSLGASRIGVETAAAIRPFVTPVDRLSTSNGDQGNLLSNGAMVGSVVPAGWTLVTNINSVEAVYGQRKRPAGDGGPDWWEIDLTSGRVRHQADATAGFSVGDTVVAMVEFDTESDSRAFTVLQCALRALDSAGNTIRQHIALADSYNSTARAPMPMGVLDTYGYPMVIPAGTTTLRFICEVGGTGTRHRVRRAAIVKVV